MVCRLRATSVTDSPEMMGAVGNQKPLGNSSRRTEHLEATWWRLMMIREMRLRKAGESVVDIVVVGWYEGGVELDYGIWFVLSAWFWFLLEVDVLVFDACV